MAYGVANGDEWRQREKERDELRWRSIRGAQVQGDTDLIFVWSDLVRSRRFPPQGCTIWLTRNDSKKYQIEISGLRAATTWEGEFPDRALYEAAQSDRKYPGEPETFDGRIRGTSPDGQYIELGSGKIFLPPMANAQPPQQQPGGYPYQGQGQQPPPWWQHYGPPSGPAPWGGGAPWGWGPPPWAAQAWGWGGGAPSWAQAVPLGTPPRDVAENPAMLQMWTSMQKMQGDQQLAQMQMMFDMWKMQQQGTNKPQSSESDFDKFAKFLSIGKDMKGLFGGGEGGGGGGITIMEHGGKTFVTKPDGSLDKEMTVGLNVVDAGTRAVNNLASRWAAAKGAGAANGGASASSTPKPKT